MQSRKRYLTLIPQPSSDDSCPKDMTDQPNPIDDLNLMPAERQALDQIGEPVQPAVDAGPLCNCDCCREQREQERRAYAKPGLNAGYRGDE